MMAPHSQYERVAGQFQHKDTDACFDYAKQDGEFAHVVFEGEPFRVKGIAAERGRHLLEGQRAFVGGILEFPAEIVRRHHLRDEPLLGQHQLFFCLVIIQPFQQSPLFFLGHRA